jgi:importin-4
LADIMPLVFGAAGDPDAQVRECACFALGQLSEHCRPEILGYSEQILPIVFLLLDDATVTVQATSCYVLEMFCERLEPEAVRPLLDPLVRKLAAMLEATNKRSVQEMVVAALAATAVAAEDEFAPYVNGVAALMAKLMALTEERMYSLRGRALECMGHMAIAVGKEAFQPYFLVTMQCAMEGLTFDSTDLHEFAYAVFANLAKVMGEEFAPVLPELVPHLIQVIGADEGQLEAVQDAQQVS